MIVEKLGSTAMIIFWIYFAAMIGIGIYCRPLPPRSAAAGDIPATIRT